MVTEVRESAHEVDTNFLSDEAIVRFLNRGQRNLQKLIARKYEELIHAEEYQDMTSGTQEYDLPSDILANRVQKVEIIQGSFTYEIERIPLRDTSSYEAQGTTSIPEYFCILGDKIRFYPSPLTSITDGIRIYYTQSYRNLGESMGVVNNATVSTISVSSLTTDDDSGDTKIQAGNYICVSDKFTGTINKTFLVSSIDSATETITISTGISLTLDSASVTSSYFGFDSADDLTDIRIADSLVVSGTTSNDGTYSITLVDDTNKRIYVSTAPVDTSITSGAASITISTYDNLTVSEAVTGISNSDIVTLAPSTCTSKFSRTFHDYLVQFGLVEVLKKAKEPIEEEKNALEELERDIANTWQDRLSMDKVKVKSY